MSHICNEHLDQAAQLKVSERKRKEDFQSFKLIDSVYSATEAAEVVLALIDDKVQFLNIKCHKLQGRFGSDTQHIEDRIAELKIAKANIQKQLAEANEKGLVVEIIGSVDMKLKVPTAPV